MDARSGQRGFTLVEISVTTAILAMLLTAGAFWTLAMHPGALTRAGDEFDAALASARAVAATEGNGATLAFLPRRSGSHEFAGFELRVYRGRPTPGGTVDTSTALLVRSDATVAEKTFGKPPFALFMGASGNVSGAAAYPQIDANGRIRFPVIPVEPACPHGGVTLTFANGRALVERTLACASSRQGPGPPNPSPTPNAPMVSPSSLQYHWPADAEQTFAATEWGYTHWFATTGGFACGEGAAIFPNVLPSPYSPPSDPSEGRASPAPPPQTPYSYPNSNGGSMNDAPAAFRLDPAAEGLCDASVADDFGQAARAGVQVMGWLTASYRGASFTHLSRRILTLPAQAFPKKGATATIGLSKTYDAEPLQPHVAFDAACAPLLSFTGLPGTTPRTPSRVPATASVALTLATLPESKTTCGGTLYDQYARSQAGEGVAFNATVDAACADSGNTWTGPQDGRCYDLYAVATALTEIGSWTEESEMGIYAAHGTDGNALYRWIVDDGTCTIQNIAGTPFARWTVLLGNGDPTPPPVPSPQPIGNAAGFGTGDIRKTVDVTQAPAPKPTRPPPWECRSPP